tara:strand:- start:2278 stop:2499 length:222 start_codon:yes stop_codon:yes gene_type:complete
MLVDVIAQTHGIDLDKAIGVFLIITTIKKAMRLNCMSATLDEPNYPEELKAYLPPQLEFPAESIRQVSAARHI